MARSSGVVGRANRGYDEDRSGSSPDRTAFNAVQGHAMPESASPLQASPDRISTDSIRDDDGQLDPHFLAQVSAAIADRNTIGLNTLVRDLHEADLGDLLHALSTPQREALIGLLGDKFD